jgi:hypothetical protein
VNVVMTILDAPERAVYVTANAVMPARRLVARGSHHCGGH